MWFVERLLILNDGIPAGEFNLVLIEGQMTGTGSIDLNGGGVGALARLGIHSAASGASIVDGGAINGLVELTDGGSEDFAGTATFSSVAGSGYMNIPGSTGHGLTGSLTITGDVLNAVDIEGSIQSGGLLEINGVCSGDLLLDEMNGDIQIDKTFSSSASLDVSGSFGSTAEFSVDGAVSGDVTIAGDLDADVSVGGKFTGAMDIDGGTGSGSLIHMLDGLGSGGSIVINSGGGEDADGDMNFGPLSVPITLDDLDMNGCIEIANSGDLNGDITTVGCLDTDPYICVDGGTTNGTITLEQGDCTPDDYEVDDSCPDCP